MKLLRLLLAAVPALLIAACGGGDDGIDDRLNVADPKVRFVHAAQLAPNVTLYRNGAAQSDATGVGYRHASAYFDVETGAADWRVGTASGNLEVGTLRFDASRGHKYTLLAVPGATAAEVLLIDDPYNRGLVTDKARVRALNASFNAQSVDVYVTAPGTNLATVTPDFSMVGYRQTLPPSGDDSAELEGGAYQLSITEPGTKNLIFTAPVTLDDNADWLVLTVPSGVAPNDIKILVVRADDPTLSALEIQSQ
jgi:hypothetical protein